MEHGGAFSVFGLFLGEEMGVGLSMEGGAGWSISLSYRFYDDDAELK